MSKDYSRFQNPIKHLSVNYFCEKLHLRCLKGFLICLRKMVFLRLFLLVVTRFISRSLFWSHIWEYWSSDISLFSFSFLMEFLYQIHFLWYFSNLFFSIVFNNDKKIICLILLLSLLLFYFCVCFGIRSKKLNQLRSCTQAFCLFNRYNFRNPV